MKNIIIWGPVRSGKSTLARMLKNTYSMNLVEVDCLKQLYERMDTSYDWEVIDSFEAGTIMNQFLIDYIYEVTKSANAVGEYFIFEGSSMDVDMPSKQLDRNKFEIICVSYPQLSETQKYQEICRYETKEDWTSQFDEKQKKELCRKNIYKSKYVQSIAQKNNFLYFDTSWKTRENIYRDVVDTIGEEMNR